MRKGLFIGINHYDHVSPLSGCNNDAMAMASVLERHANGRPNFSSKVLTSAEEKLTLSHMKQQIQSLFSGDCDVALLYFAGHGQFDTSIDEGLLIPQDYQPGGDGIRISDILEWADKAPHIKNKIIILDCCQAGAAGAMRNLRGGSSVIGEGMTILTACKKEQSALESRGHGVFTDLLLQALHGLRRVEEQASGTTLPAGQHGQHRRQHEQQHAHQVDAPVAQTVAQRGQRQQHHE